MATFVFAFILLLLIVLGMSLGVIFMNKRIAGSCGGLNNISGADTCVICDQPVDKNNPLRARLEGREAPKPFRMPSS